ncbi:plasmid pRiA4b ORF-3 family protein [Aurantimonas sp. C2-6-R+9]|uniref:plasmid pRiA4b ORF-3 family protein n=1 Tax=unclassified Aurantimonas TaxID=2638230 RepID=UPI002E17D88C|nr:MULTISPECIES: plasmid pRiA4b ORF-3 family protein [unclassified Aurantimonas]MEC5293611.1 plasmid pRiA4b ORF-3 family protein [Aurantimonas sp. C2-3-R2]MEC5383799.1 plasmid pRiA4b ORF-3 family protein [Aurantimonas sp. C2-6-R+9]MEC5414683.1 plasmid pRiA4b ORF-3 family protein [Aurantimonas sp. C2-4-R8]
MSPEISIARLKVVLDDVAPAVMRKIEVPLNLRLDRLHTVLQEAIGWTDSHLWEFRVDDTGFGIPDPDLGFGGGALDARKATLQDVIEDLGVRSFEYLYDFGDGWEHSIRIEAITPATEGLHYPRLIEASGRCPPEDVGGPWGYDEFREALADPNHDRHDEMVEWWGESFDPNDIDDAEISKALDRLAAQWSRRRKPNT